MSVGFDMRKMMKQVQKMQTDMSRVQEELKTMTVEASAGGGAVTVVVTGTQEIVSIKIADGVLDPNDKEALEDLLVAAVGEGLKKSRDLAQAEVAKVTGGMALPPGMA